MGSASERREKIIEALCMRRMDTIDNLASEFGVSRRTLRYDIEILSSSYPLVPMRGRYSSGVKVEDWYRLRRIRLTGEQTEVLQQLMQNADSHQRKILLQMLKSYGRLGEISPPNE
ncbi:MAG TPA: DeoR family transcriptional regulator [Lachnospiraceae bacterium]|nr:DeoR family transcriptional regulator [Lachnospiraceae bacterium]